MHKRAGQLNQAFVKKMIRAVSLAQPKFFEHIVRFVKQSAIKALKIAEIMRVQIFSPAAFDQRGNFRALFAHAENVKGIRQDLQDEQDWNYL